MSGMESGDPLTYFQNINAGTASTTFARTGTYSLRCGGGQYRTTQLAVGQSPASMTSFAVAFGFLADVFEDDAGIFSAAPGILPHYRLNAARQIEFAQPDGGSLGAVIWTGSAVLAVDTWYVLAIEMYRHGSDRYWPGRVKLYDNSLVWLEDSGWQAVIGTGSAANINSVNFGKSGLATIGGVHHYDDMIMVTGGAGPPLVKIVRVEPSGDSATDNAWTALGGGTKESEVDEVVADADTTYIQATGATQAQTFTHAATGIGSADNVVAVGVYARHKSADDSGTADVAVSTTNTTLTDTREAWLTNQWINHVVTCNGKTMTVTSNTATVLTGTAWSGGGNPGNGFAWSIAAGTRFIQGRLRSTFGAVNIGVLASTSAYQWYTRYRTTSPAGNPWTATGGAETDVDAVEFGLSSVALGSGQARNTWSMMEVAYGPEWRDDELPRVGWFGFTNSVLGTVSAPALGTTMTDTGQSWPIDMLSGARLKINSGTGSGQTRYITLNTATVVTIGVAWVTAPDSTSQYSIHMDGIASGVGTTTTLTDVLKAWRVGQLKGMNLRRPDAAAAGDRERAVASNTATVITVSPAWTNAPALNEAYEVFSTGRNAVSA